MVNVITKDKHTEEKNLDAAVSKAPFSVIANGVKQSRILYFNGLLRVILRLRSGQVLAMTLLPTFKTAALKNRDFGNLSYDTSRCKLKSCM